MPDRSWMTCGVYEAAQKPMGSVLSKVGSSVSSIPGMDSVVDASKKAKTAVVDTASAGLSATGDAMKSIPGSDKVIDLTDSIEASAKAATESTMDATKSLKDSVVDSTKTGLNVTGDAISGVPGVSSIKESASGAIDATKQGTKRAMDSSMDLTKNAYSATTEMTGAGLDVVGGAVGDGVAAIPGGESVIEHTNSVKEQAKVVTEPVADMSNQATDLAKNTANASLAGFTDAFDTLGSVAGFQSIMGGMFGNVDKSDAGLERMFSEMDADGSGKVSEEEMKAAIAKVYGEGLDDTILHQMMKAADTDGDGEIDLVEFKTIMRAGPDSK